MENYTDKNWYKSISNNNTFYTWSLGGIDEAPEAYPIISLIRKIPNAQNLRSLNGILAVNIELSEITSILKPAQISSNTAVYLMNRFIFSSYKHNQILSYCARELPDDALLNALKEQFPENCTDNSSFYAQLNHHKYLVGYSSIDQSDWHLVITIP